jgi:large-conductance mechanosensitive channel
LQKLNIEFTKRDKKVRNFKKTFFMNWPVLIAVGFLLLALVIFLVRRNMKDEEEFEHQVNEDYHKPKDEEGDVRIDEVTK